MNVVETRENKRVKATLAYKSPKCRSAGVANPANLHPAHATTPLFSKYSFSFIFVSTHHDDPLLDEQRVWARVCVAPGRRA